MPKEIIFHSRRVSKLVGKEKYLMSALKGITWTLMQANAITLLCSRAPTFDTPKIHPSAYSLPSAHYRAHTTWEWCTIRLALVYIRTYERKTYNFGCIDFRISSVAPLTHTHTHAAYSHIARESHHNCAIARTFQLRVFSFIILFLWTVVSDLLCNSHIQFGIYINMASKVEEQPKKKPFFMREKALGPKWIAFVARNE